MNVQKQTRVLYSFPHKLGADRICTTAWQQVNGLATAGADVTVFPGVLQKPFSKQLGVHVRPTLAKGNYRIPYKLLGRMRALKLHDYIVSRRLEKMAGEIETPVGSTDRRQIVGPLLRPAVAAIGAGRAGIRKGGRLLGNLGHCGTPRNSKCWTRISDIAATASKHSSYECHSVFE